jgi:hypothetical protein
MNAKSILLVTFCTALTLTSCGKKDWTCVCNLNTGMKNSNTIYIEQVNKKTAKDRCKMHDKSYNAGGVTVVETCDLQ